MKNTPIINKLIELKKENIVSFHVPGHKNGRIYDETNHKKLKDFLCNIDTTEIEGTDNLHNPKEIIQQSQKNASRIFKSEETFFLVNGSTSGIYSMIMASTSPGDKILADRNCHQSVINATFLGDLKPIYIYPYMDKKQGIPMGILPQDIEKQLIKHKDIKAVVLTYPTYYGTTCDLKKIGEIVHKYDKILLVDEAHGAHFGLSDRLPQTALTCGADAVVQSTHKTLSSFTQSSMLHIQGNRIDREKLKFMLRMHQTSSPSYILLSSLDLALIIYETKGKELMKNLLGFIEDFRNEASEIEGINILGKEIEGNYGVKSTDSTRLWFGLNNITGYDLEIILRKEFNIQMELSNSYGVLAVTSIANIQDDFDRLVNALKIIATRQIFKKDKEFKPYNYKDSQQKLTPKEAFYKGKTRVLFKESEGCISGEYIIPYPPGIPIIIPGELINKEVIEYVNMMLDEGMKVLGIKDNRCEWIEVLQ